MLARLRAAAAGWSEDDAMTMGAALAYYALFSLAPLLVLAIAVLGMVYGEESARNQVVDQIRAGIDQSSADAAKLLLDNAQLSSLSATSLVGLASLLFGASGLFTSLRGSLHKIWRLDIDKKESLWWWLVKTYLLATLMVAVVCGFLLSLLLASAFVPMLVGRFGLGWLGPLVDFGVSTLFMTLLLAVTYRVLSDRTLAYSQVLLGAFVAAVLFTVGKMAIGAYLGYAGLASAYGTAGSVVVFLAWIYYSAQIVFFGAEVVRFGLPQPVKA